MKKALFFASFMAFIFQACQTLTSQTLIDPQKSFVLGKGKHGSYVAQIQNTGKDDIEVILIDENGGLTSLGMLKKNEKETYRVPKNTTVQFKNTSSDQKGVIDIKLEGDTNLSMGYQANQN